MKTKFLMLLGMLAPMFAVTDARAETWNADGAGEFIVYSNTDSRIYFNSGTNYLEFASAMPNATYLDVWVDTSNTTGNLSWYAAAAGFTSKGIGSTGYSGLVSVSDDPGTVDFYDSDPFQITLRMQIAFTGNGVTTPCHTASFNVTIDTASAAGTWIPAGLLYDSTTGVFRATNPNFSVPAVSTNGTQCGSAAAATALNSALALGGGAGGHQEIRWNGYFANTYGSPATYPTGSP